MTKQIIASICVLGLLGMAVGVVATAAATGSVAATVTPRLLSVSVSDGNVSYGIVSLNTTQDTTASGVNETQTATNNGNASSTLNIKSSDATGGTTWELAATAGTNTYVHKFKGGDALVWTQLPVDNDSYATLDVRAAASSVDFDLQITTPTVTADHNEKAITVTVQATE